MNDQGNTRMDQISETIETALATQAMAAEADPRGLRLRAGRGVPRAVREAAPPGSRRGQDAAGQRVRRTEHQCQHGHDPAHGRSLRRAMAKKATLVALRMK